MKIRRLASGLHRYYGLTLEMRIPAMFENFTIASNKFSVRVVALSYASF
jgi:hypothetical protein